MLIIYLEFIRLTMAPAKQNKVEIFHHQLVIAGLRESLKPCSLENAKPARCPP